MMKATRNRLERIVGESTSPAQNLQRALCCMRGTANAAPHAGTGAAKHGLPGVRLSGVRDAEPSTGGCECALLAAYAHKMRELIKKGKHDGSPLAFLLLGFKSYICLARMRAFVRCRMG
jgi:hypothetical protein